MVPPALPHPCRADANRLQALQDEALALEAEEVEDVEGQQLDRVRFGEEDWRGRYYIVRFGAEGAGEGGGAAGGVVRQATVAYVEGLTLLFKYLYTGMCCWRWAYPFGYAPLASDLAATLAADDAPFVVAAPSERPLPPFEYLMAVLHPNRKVCAGAVGRGVGGAVGRGAGGRGGRWGGGRGGGGAVGRGAGGGCGAGGGGCEGGCGADWGGWWARWAPPPTRVSWGAWGRQAGCPRLQASGGGSAAEKSSIAPGVFMRRRRGGGMPTTSQVLSPSLCRRTTIRTWGGGM